VIGVLLVAVEAVLLALFAADLASDLTLLAPPDRLALLAVVLALSVPLAWRPLRRRIARSARAAAMALGIVSLAAGGLAAVSEAGSARMLTDWDKGANARLAARAALLEADFHWLLDAMVRPFGTALVDTDRPQAAFLLVEKQQAATILPRDRFGVALYGAAGDPLAWAGNSSLAPGELLAATGPGPIFMVGGHEEAPRLFAMQVDAFTGIRQVSEFLLRPPPADPAHEPTPGAQLAFLPHWPGVGPATVLARFAGTGPDAMAGIFAEQGDRHWWRPGRQGGLTLSVPLRSPSGDELLTANLGDRHADQELQARRTAVRRIGILVLLLGLVAAAVLLARRLPGRGARLLIGILAIVGCRVLLLLIAPDDALPPLALYDITVYSSSALWGLLRSPADLLLTAAAALGIAWLLRWSSRAIPWPGDPARQVALRAGAGLAALLATAGALLALHAFLDRVVLDSRIDVTRVDLVPPLFARIALQSGLFMLVAAAGTVVAGLVALALQRPDRVVSPRRPGIPTVLRATLATLTLTAVYVPLLQHSYGNLRRDFFEFDLRPRVLYQSEGRRYILRESLGSVEDPGFAATAGFEEAGESPGSLAYRLWGRTPLAAMGLASSLSVFDEEGQIVSRFAVNLGIMFEPRYAEARDAAGQDPVAIPPREGVTIKKAVLFGSRWVTTPGATSRLIVMTVIDDYDNVPLLGAESAYLPLLRARAFSHTNPELLRFEPLVAVFGRSLERVYESGGEIPAPSPATVAALVRAPYVWTSDAVGEGPARILYFRGPEETFAVAYARRDLIGSIAAWLRISLLNGSVLLAAALLARAVRAMAGRPSAPLAPGGTIYARLTTIFLLTALVPLLSLAWFVTRYSAQESERILVASGLSSLQTVRRVAEDYTNLTDPGYGPNLDDEVVFWLSRVVRQDINLYRGADLVATSTPELYGSFLLNTRLEGSIYRALYVDREPFRLARVPIADFDYRTLSAPMRLDVGGTIGVVSIPLAAQGRAVARRADQLADAILISSCLTIALLALVGWLVARRVSTPIALLAGASRRLAGGDLDVRVASPAGGEIGILVDSFNRMAESLRQQRHDLRRRSEYIETILTTATTGVLSLDARGVLITINPAAQQLLARDGSAPQPGDDLSEYLEGDTSLAPFGEALRRSLHGSLEGEASLTLGPGEEDRRLRAVFLPFTHGDDALPGRIVIVEDVTDIVRSGRLAAWAEMARRVAHEVKNPLTPIQLSVEHVRRLWKAGDPRFGTVLQECLDNIQGQVKALRQIATEFSAYARLPRLRPEPTRVEDMLAEALRPYAAAPPPGVDMVRTVEPGLPELRIDRAIIMRVLVNLVENALQAMPRGGRLEVAARRSPDGVPPRPGRRGADGGVRITVSDTGGGIEPAVLSRIFEPYFSTKTGGTGLGLAIARNAIEEHGGTIEIDSSPGAGTTVTVDLPVPAGAISA